MVVGLYIAEMICPISVSMKGTTILSSTKKLGHIAQFVMCLNCILYVSDCRSRGHKFVLGLAPYFRGD